MGKAAQNASGAFIHRKHPSMKTLLTVTFALATAVSTTFAADALDDAASTAAAVAEGITEDDAKLTADWQGKVAAGIETTSGNTEKDGMNMHLEAKKLRGETVLIATADGAWEENEVTDADGTNKRDERTKGNVKAEVNAKQRFDGFFIYGDLAGSHDGVAGIKYRFIESLGLGTYLVDTDTLKFSVEAGLAEVQEELDGMDSDEYTAYRLAERADWVPTFAEGVSFFESASYLADFDDSDHFFADFEAGIDIPMFSGISMTFKGVVNYNNQPAAGKEKTDRSLIAQFGYNF